MATHEDLFGAAELEEPERILAESLVKGMFAGHHFTAAS
jgi:hypothetical protein